MIVYKISTHLNSEEQSIGVEKIEPVWGDSLSAKEYYSHSAPRTRVGLQILKPGELGCTLSHLKILRRISESGIPGLIIESDIDIDRGKVAKIEEYIKSYPQTEFLHCARYNSEDFRCWKLKDGRRIVDTSYRFWGTCAYYSSVKTALALIAFHERHGPGLADDWHRFFAESSIVPFYHAFFEHPDGDSTIERKSIPRSYSVSVRQLSKNRASTRLNFAYRKLVRTLKYGFPK